MDDKFQDARLDSLVVSPADAEKLSHLFSLDGEAQTVSNAPEQEPLTLEDLKSLVDSVQRAWFGDVPREASDLVVGPSAIEKLVQGLPPFDLGIREEFKLNPGRFDRASLPRMVHRGEVYPWKPLAAFSEKDSDEDTGDKKL